MTSPAPRASDAYTREERREREFALRTDAVVLATSLAALVAFGASWFVLDGVGRWSDALVLALVAGISNLARRDSRRGRGLSLTGAIMLAAIPVGAGLGIPLIAIVGAAANWRSVGAQRIVFNAATGCLAGVLAAMVYVILGAPVVPAAALGETRGLIQMGLGLVVGIIVQALTTATLVAGVLWASRGIAMRTTMRGLFRESGLDYLATIGLAFLIVVTWVPVGAGAVSVVLLAPIFVVSRFAVAQWSNEWTAQVRAVSAFTTAMDERHPGAAVHAADVARICEWIADELAMSSVDAQALGLAGALHGIDALALPNGSGLRSAISALDSVDVLAPALPILQRYRDPDDGVGRPPRPARVLAVADAYARVRARDVPAGAREPHLLAYGRLLDQQDDRFDPSVIAALGRVLERVDPLDRGIARSAETVAGDPRDVRMSVPLRSGATVVPALAAGIVIAAVVGWIQSDQAVDRRALPFVALALVVIAAGELVRLDLGDRLLAPVSTATAVGLVLAPLGRDGGGLPLAQAVLAVALGLAAGGAVLALTGRPVPLSDLAARFIGVGFVAALGRSQMFGPDLIQWWQRPEVPRWLGALALIGAATVGVGVEIALWTASRSRTWRISWLALVRADLERSGAVGAIMTNVGALMAFAYPAIGVWALPLYLVPIATAVIALRRAQRIRDIQHQLITALSRLSDETGHTNPGHAQRVARLSVALGEELGLGPLDLLAVRDAALVHDVGQVTLAEPIPDGATLGAAPAEQAQVVLDTVRIIEAAGLPEPMVEAVRGSIVQFRQLREQGQTIPVTGRIVKVANAYDDLTRGRRSARAAALERIHLGLGYEYDPAVVDALARVTENA